MMDARIKNDVDRRRPGVYLIQQIMYLYCIYSFPMHPKLHEFIDEYLRRIDYITIRKDPYRSMFFPRVLTQTGIDFSAVKVDTRQLPQVKGLFRR